MADRLPPTDQQRSAIAAEGFSVVLSSGAGCGKTSVLTARYLKHLAEDGAEVVQVVAITFTERAAREMRDRIRQAIAQRLQQASGEAAERWARHLRNLESAAIGTIHSFCGNILRHYAVAGGLDPRFEILEEVLAGSLRSESVRSRLQILLTQQSPAGTDLRELVVLYGWHATVEAIRALAAEPDAAAWSRWLGETPARIEASWLDRERQSLRRRWIEHLADADPKVSYCLNLLRAMPSTSTDMQANVARLLAETGQLGGAADLAAAWKDLRECAMVGRERARAWGGDNDAYAQVRDAFEGYRRTLDEKLGVFDVEPEKLKSAIRVGQRFINVALEVAEAYQERKQRGGYLDFQDLLVQARDLVRDYPEVRDSLRQRFRFILVDEMQDTDPVQMELIRLLCGDVGLQTGKLFAVGDHKQSIYRFRGAEAQLFRELRHSVPLEGQLGLTRNFRSQPPILDFVNALCSQHMPGYEPLESNRPAVDGGACIEFLWATPSANEREEKVPAIRRREAAAIAGRIRAMLDDGMPRVWDQSSATFRPVALQDVVLLFRSMSNVAIYERALRAHGLDYYLVGGRAFFAQQEIYDLLNVLRALENPDDALSLAGALRSPFGCLSDESLFVLTSGRRGEIWAGLFDNAVLARLSRSQRNAVERARRNFTCWRDLKDRVPIARLIGVLFADTGYDAAMQFEPLGDRKLANLWKLQDLARTFDRSGIFGLPDFIQRLGDLVTNQPREELAATLPEKSDVVKLMSIHQAKGLEFPVVFVPDMAAMMGGSKVPAARWLPGFGCVVRPPADEEPPPFSKYGWELGNMAETLADWEEDLRILYVACTRAQDVLVLSAGFREPLRPTGPQGLSVPMKNPNAWMTTLGERFNIVTGECIADDVAAETRPQVRVQVVVGLSSDPVKPVRRIGSGQKPGSLIDEPPLAQPPTSDVEKPTADPVQQLFRAVMEYWDFADPEGWKEHLERCRLETECAGAVANVVSDWLQAFAETKAYASVRRAVWHSANIEYLASATPETGSRVVRGTIDLMWRDDDDDWQMLAFVFPHTRTVSDNRTDLGRHVAALTEQIGSAPKTIHIVRLADGSEQLAKASEIIADIAFV